MLSSLTMLELLTFNARKDKRIQSDFLFNSEEVLSIGLSRAWLTLESSHQMAKRSVSSLPEVLEVTLSLELVSI